MDIKILKDEIGKGYRLFKAFEKGQEVLTALEALEQTEKDSMKRIENLQVEERSLKESAAKSKATIQKAEETSKGIIDEANSGSASIIAAARRKASELLSAAEAKAKEVTDSIANLQSQKAQAETELSGVQLQLISGKADLDKLEDLKAEAKKAFGIK